MGKKKKRDYEAEGPNDPSLANGASQSSEKQRKKKSKKTEDVKSPANEMPTVSIAVPGSIIDNAQSLELATRLAGQVARAAAIFRIDEIVVVDNKSISEDTSTETVLNNSDENESGAAFLLRILTYLETPQYLRKDLFPKHNSLRFVGLLSPLDAPHHLRKHEWCSYREGITRKNPDGGSVGTLVDVGLSKNIVVNEVVEAGKRVTVAMGTNRNTDRDQPRKIVSPSTPRKEGMYWGYRVRYASNISSLFKNSPYKGGYDHRIGTSEHGLVINSSELSLPPFRHLLIAFGGLAGLEECVEEDENLKGKTVGDIFDSYLNTCPHQGSRTIRTEEAIFISLQYFQEPINRVSTKYQHVD
ncbi:hypothetical protein F511_34360 [Dorcoceras hygrometricum]|uniref:RNA methyltransferase n=1 Tax=Dorcoceras hygrometricum TaxID=472368 RepID=A0A2Z7BGU1_9LAMI|nr:hypothetical protein F511_34360 [Dorcoceras hygrometricum]